MPVRAFCSTDPIKAPTSCGAPSPRGLTSTSTNTGTAKLNINANQGNTPPSGVGTAVPTFGGEGTPVTLRVTVTPGTLPASTGITVTGNAASIGGGPLTFLDNGVAPDVLAGDNIYSASAVVGPGLPSGAVTIPFTITDAQARTGTGNINFQVVGPPPACPTGGESFSATNINSDGDYGLPTNGTYTFTPTKGGPAVVKDAIWGTVGLHGTEWRIVVASER